MKTEATIATGVPRVPVSAEPVPAVRANPVPAYSWYALAILTLIYSCHYLDRTMIAIIVEPVRAEFKLNDSQIGLLTGLAYGATFALAGIPLGLLIDRVNRVKLLTVLVSIWSGMTILSGLAQNYIQLLLARMGVGASEAGGSPTSLSLISDFFPPSRRATAVGCFFLSNAVGATLSFLIGGLIAAKYGWRAAMFVAGIPGLLLAIVWITTAREPKRGATEAKAVQVEKAQGLSQVFKYIGAHGALVQLLAATSIMTAAVATLGAWLPSFGMRFHGLSIKEAGLLSALAGGLCGALGSVIGGMLSDKLGKHRARRRIDFCAALCCVGVLLAIGGLLTLTTVVALPLLCLVMLVSFAVFPASFGSMLSLTAPNMRGLTAASMQVATNLIGYGFGPFMVGLLSDLYGGPHSLRYAMLTVMSVCFPWAALHFVLSARRCDKVHK